MACALAGSVPVSQVPASALSAPLSVHGVVLFALPGSVVHVDAAEYVAWMSSRIDSLSHQLRRAQQSPTTQPPTSSSSTTRNPPTLSTTTTKTSSTPHNPPRRTLPPLLPPHLRDLTASTRANERLSLQSLDRSEDELPASTSFFATRKQQLLKRIFDRASDPALARSASATVPRRSISMDVLRRRPSSASASAAATPAATSPTARSSPMSGVTAGSSPRGDLAPRSPSVLAYPKPKRWTGRDAGVVVAPRNAPDTPLFADTRLADSASGSAAGSDPADEDANDSLRSMSARDLAAVAPPRRSRSDAARLRGIPKPAAFVARNQSAIPGLKTADVPQSPALKPGGRRPATPQARFDALHCALRTSNPAYTIELPAADEAEGVPSGTQRRGSTAGRRSLSLGDERFRRDSSMTQLTLSPEKREKRSERADAALARRASTVGFVPIAGPGVEFGEEEVTEEEKEGKAGRMNSRMRRSLRKVKKRESIFRTSLAVDGDELARTMSTGAIPPNFGRNSVAGGKKAFRTYTARWKEPEDAQKDSRVRRFASLFRLRQAKAPYQPV